MRTKFRLLALVLTVATISLQCTKDNDDVPSLPTTIDQFFEAKTFSHEGNTLKYRECNFNMDSQGKASLVIVLHGQYANGSDNEAQLHQDAMIRAWHYFDTNNKKVVMLAPQCPTGYEWDENPATLARLTMPELLKAMIDEYVRKHTSVDASRIYICGYSDAYKPAGAGGVWRMLSEYTDTFAAGMVVAADPDDTISAVNVAKTPILSVKGVSDIYAVAPMLDTFADMIRDEGGVIREDVVRVGSREELCREAFNTERLDWLMQYEK
ncbi:MAG: hypothetical protein IIV16_01200 [Alistipes sp.]|nr:hypothetical protein [Alistipes sp.]